MIAFPNAKINLGLKVIGKRPDGYHNIETVFYPVGLSDVLEIMKAPDGQFSFESTGLQIPGDPEKNICILAFRHLSSNIEHPASNIQHPLVKIHLHKIIPPGSGLGGGSSDGAFTLKLLNDLFFLGLSFEKMEQIAGNLGSDCPFFIRNKPVIAYGKGDRFEEVNIDLSGYIIIIVIPGIHVDTAVAYRMIDEEVQIKQPTDQSQDHLKDIVRLPVEQWKDKLINDFEIPVLSKFPVIREIREKLYAAGALYASLSGSGSAIYGIFPPQTPDLSAFKDNFVWVDPKIRY